MSESDGKTWAMVKPETGERVSVGQLSDEAPRNDGTAIDKLWGQVRSALEQGLGRVDSGVFAVVLHAIRTAESLGRNEERKRTEDEVSEASRAAFVAARRKTLADAIVLRRGAPGGSGWEGARYDADGNAASTVGHADPLVVLAAVLGKEAPRPPESGAAECVAEKQLPGESRHVGREVARFVTTWGLATDNEEMARTHAAGMLADLDGLLRRAREEGEAGALAKLRQTTHARLAESGAIERARAEGHRAGAASTLARVEAEADGYRRRAQAIRVEAEVAEAKADALTGAVAQIRREEAP